MFPLNLSTPELLSGQVSGQSNRLAAVSLGFAYRSEGIKPASES